MCIRDRHTTALGDHNVTVTASNLSGSDSKTITLTVNPAKPLFQSGLYEPTGMALWLDASELTSAVSSWVDKSGNNNHASQSGSPALASEAQNGLSAISFDGTDDYFDIDLDFLADVSHSAFVVLKTTGYSNIYGAATSGSGSNSLHVGFSNSSTFRMNYWGCLLYTSPSPRD